MSEAPERHPPRTDKFQKPVPGSKTQLRNGRTPSIRKDSIGPGTFPSAGNAVDGTQDPDGPLTELQKRFVHHLVHDKMGQTAAVKAAGYSPNPSTGTTLMKNPKVIKAIAEAREEYARASGITRKKVIDGMMEAVDMARLKGEPLTMIAGWREIGKMCGLYEPQKTKVEVSVNGQVMIQRLQTMTDAELLSLVEGDPTALDGEFTLVDE